MQVDLKPASDVLAGAMARAASQSTIHPLDTLKVPVPGGSMLSRLPQDMLSVASWFCCPGLGLSLSLSPSLSSS
jgi:hypothetical protein